MAAAWTLVSATDLSTFLGRTVAAEKADTALRVASGWLQSATGPRDWTSPLPDDVWAWMLELASFALDNPTSLSERNDSDTRRAWEPRRAEILNTARQRYGIGSSATAGPLFTFPTALPWP